MRVAGLFEGSGTVLITLLNHVAMMMVVGAFHSLINQASNVNREVIKMLITKAGVFPSHDTATRNV